MKSIEAFKKSSNSLKNKQLGLSLIKLFLVLALLGTAGILALRSVPSWVEFSSIKKGVDRLESEGLTDVTEIRRKWDERAPLEYITSLAGFDLNIKKTSKGAKINFDYEKRIPLFGNAYLVFEFTNDTN